MELLHHNPPVIGFCAFSGTGKTSLLTAVLPLLTKHGLRVAMIKHAHHTFDVDQPGKDSYKLREAGAEQVLLASRKRWALMTENRIEQDEPELPDLLTSLSLEQLDLVLVEGFKHAHFPKIELHRAELSKPLLYTEDPSIIALATDQALPKTPAIPQLDLNNPRQIADFILDYIKQTDQNRASETVA